MAAGSSSVITHHWALNAIALTNSEQLGDSNWYHCLYLPLVKSVYSDATLIDELKMNFLFSVRA